MWFSPFVTYLLIIITIIVSYRGLKYNSFLERYMFRVDRVLPGRDYLVLFSSGFLHISWLHLMLNMFTLYFFGPFLESLLGPLWFLVVYCSGIIGGSLLALLVYRHHGDYCSVGASGATYGIIFASIVLVPGMTIMPFGIPIPIPGWFYGLVYLLYTIYGIRSKINNVGHEAHLGGAVTAMLLAMALRPEAIVDNYRTIAIILFPAIIFIYIIITRPYVLYIDNLFYNEHFNNTTIDDRYNIDRVVKQKEIDRILEKIHKNGMDSLTKLEKESLDQYSRNST